MKRAKRPIILTIGLIFKLALISSNAGAAPYITYPDFVLMDTEGRYEVVHMVQDYAVENEYQSRLHIKKLNSAKASSFFDLFMKEAHAAINGHGKPCMYAGWVSVLQQSGSRAYCNNPRKYQAAIARYNASDESFKQDLKYAQTLYNQYQGEVRNGKFAKISYSMNDNQLNLNIDREPSKGSCNINSGAVLCNPLIFGKVNGKVMCVPGDADYKGYNSSFLCERAVNKIKVENEGKESPNEYTDLMDGIIQEIDGNKDKASLFLATLKDMYDMCMCSQDEGKIDNMRINKDYADRMFYSRTCAGIIYQSQTVLEKLSKNQKVSCSLLVENDNATENWLKFAREAYYNVQIETENLGRDWVTKLEVIDRDSGETQPEEETIYGRREAARKKRGGQFCPIDIEIPDDETDEEDENNDEVVDEEDPKACDISVVKNAEAEGYKVFFRPGLGEDGSPVELSSFKFTPELKFEKDDEGKLTAQFTPPKTDTSEVSESEKNESDDSETEEDESETEEDERRPATAPTKKEPKKEESQKEEFLFEARIGDEMACHTKITDGDQVVDEGGDENTDQINPDDEAGPGESKCSLALELEPNDSGHTIIASAKDGDKEIAPGTEGYSITFINTSIEGEPAAEESESEDGLVPEENKKSSENSDQPEQEVITGSELEAGDDGFRATLPASDKEQKIVAILKGPKSCEKKAEVSVSSNMKSPAGSPQFRKTPPAQRASPMRHMKALRGNY